MIVLGLRKLIRKIGPDAVWDGLGAETCLKRVYDANGFQQCEALVRSSV